MAAPGRLHDLAVERDGLLCPHAPHDVTAGFFVDPGVLRFDLHVAHHDVGPERVAAQDQLVVGYLEEVTEARSLQDHEVRPVRPGDVVFCLRMHPVATSVDPYFSIRPEDQTPPPAVLEWNSKGRRVWHGGPTWKRRQSVRTRRS